MLRCICSVCVAKAWLGERGDKRSMKNRPSTWQGGEDYQAVNKLYLAEKEMDRLFNDDRYIDNNMVTVTAL